MLKAAACTRDMFFLAEIPCLAPVGKKAPSLAEPWSSNTEAIPRGPTHSGEKGRRDGRRLWEGQSRVGGEQDVKWISKEVKFNLKKIYESGLKTIKRRKRDTMKWNHDVSSKDNPSQASLLLVLLLSSNSGLSHLTCIQGLCDSVGSQDRKCWRFHSSHEPLWCE